MTRQYPLKLTDSEDQAVESLRAQYAQNDIVLSYNDAVRALVRHGFAPAPADVDGVGRAIQRHTDDCEWCTPDQIRCPFGWRLIALRNAFLRPPDRVEAPALELRRTPGGRRPLLPPPPGGTK